MKKGSCTALPHSPWKCAAAATRAAAEREMALKRNLYFAARTRVVWDVDVLRERLIRVYRSEAPESAAVYRQGEVAEAEPAVPGWRFPVDELFD